MPGAEHPSLSGAIVLRNLDAYRAEVGADCVARAIASLPENAQTELDHLVPAAWVSVETVDAAYEAIAVEAGRDPSELYAMVVRAAIRNALRTVWKWLLRLTTDKALVSRTPMIYARGHNTGHLETRIVEPGEAEIVLTGWPGMSRLRMLGVACGVEATLEVAGRRGVSVTFDPTSEGATYRAKWTP